MDDITIYIPTGGVWCAMETNGAEILNCCPLAACSREPSDDVVGLSDYTLGDFDGDRCPLDCRWTTGLLRKLVTMLVYSSHNVFAFQSFISHIHHHHLIIPLPTHKH